MVQLLLEDAAAAGMFSGSPLRTANQLVREAWDASARIMGGALGLRPHKLTIAAVALGRAIRMDHAKDPLAVSHVYAFCLSQILDLTSRESWSLGLTKFDEDILQTWVPVFLQFANASEAAHMGREIAGMMAGPEAVGGAPRTGAIDELEARLAERADLR